MQPNRPDQNLSPEEMKALWEKSPERAMHEWSFRIFEIPALAESPEQFITYLTDIYTREKSKGLDVYTTGNVQMLSERFRSGDITLQEWADQVRSVISGKEGPAREKVPRIDADVRRHLEELFRNALQLPRSRR